MSLIFSAMGTVYATYHFRIYDTSLAYLLIVQETNSIRQSEIHAAEPLIPEPSSFEVEVAVEKLERYKLTVLIRFQ
jgi:hypothetical protein